jgi:mono/diheme cytochrome c family protein
MARGAGLIAAALLFFACRGERARDDARLAFKNGGAPLRELGLAELKDVPVETFTAFDPYYNKKKTYRALPLRPILERGFAGVPLDGQDFLLRAKDGYTVPIAGVRLLEPGAYVAIADVDVPSWEPIGPQQANPGPFYLVWRGDAQQDLETHPRPWQLQTIEIASFTATFPHTVPAGEAPDSPAMRGFATFRAQCIHCHAVNREGGHVGPDLNVPQSIVEYRPEAQIRAYIKDPLAFRYGNMPPHPHLTDANLDDLVAYFRAMKDRKHDPDAGAR